MFGVKKIIVVFESRGGMNLRHRQWSGCSDTGAGLMVIERAAGVARMKDRGSGRSPVG